MRLSSSPSLWSGMLGTIVPQLHKLAKLPNNWCKLLMLNRLQCILCQQLRLCRMLLVHIGFLGFVLLGAMPECLGQDVSLPIIAQIESSGRADAIGDGGKALGLYQLHSACITDFNKRHKTAYSHKDALNPDIASKIANWYANYEVPRLLRHFKQSDTLENRLTAYNMGVGAVIKGKRAISYINKYRRLSNAL